MSQLIGGRDARGADAPDARGAGRGSGADARLQPETLQAMLARSARRVWWELPRVLAVGALWAASLLPGVLSAVVAAPWWIVVIAIAPAFIGLTGVARYGALVVTGGKPLVREALRLDLMLGLTLAAGAAVVAAVIAAGGAVMYAGFGIGAGVAVLAPLALAYGAVRERRGLTAWRGAIILAAYRPSTALTLLALGCLSGFAIVATAGVLVLVVPVLLAAFGAAAAGALLDEIDSAQAASATRSAGSTIGRDDRMRRAG
ncbi:hypothetical protein N1031_07705 [Herbiconiux moechotypicola]|uniref:Integral membrane protein n=1 Tax=Herbiconiux moechotypicola TaxID=637393 RepID=A0ABP5QFK5_9MICO|nr:hypothetical protein [Herbiconiux moechotypicola]MCS5729643.1 hypothetical protein [Herbiconiux moechotypicola]